MDFQRPGPSGYGDEHESTATPTVGVPVMDIARSIGPIGDTYEEEFEKLKTHLVRSGDLLGPSAPVVFVNYVKKLHGLSLAIANDKSLGPYHKCVSLFHAFDAMVLAYKNLSFVYCDGEGARSVYGYSELALKTMLSRVEAITRMVAVAVHDAYSLAALNRVVASAEQRLSQVRTEKDMLKFFRGVSGVTDILPSDSVAAAAADTERLPRGIERYKDPYSEADTLFLRLYASCGDKNFVRDFHDAVYLMATANSPATLPTALESRLADRDRNVVLLEVPDDRLFATSLCAAAIAFLRKKLTENSAGRNGQPTDEMATYRINYGRIFSKFRGESERNFDTMMDWIKNSVRASDRFRVFWFPDIENLMSPRTSNDQEHIATIKNSMLQHMDSFNKDRTLRSFLLLFNSSEGPLDSAFARRLETVVSVPSNPLADLSVAKQAVGAELSRYHINVSDELLETIAARAGSVPADPQRSSSRSGGFAYVQATLRDRYVSQKLALRYESKCVDIKQMSVGDLKLLLGRYLSGSTSFDILYDLDERPILFGTSAALAFHPGSRLGTAFSSLGYKSVKYNANLKGDPKNLDEQTAARTIFLHDVD